MNLVEYFKNTNVSGTQRLVDFCGSSVAFNLFKIIEHWTRTNTKVIKYFRDDRKDILSVAKLSEILNISKYKVLKYKKLLASIGLLKTDYYGIPCHCNYSIDEFVSKKLYSLEPDYKRNIYVGITNGTRSIPTRDVFIKFCIDFLTPQQKQYIGNDQLMALYDEFLEKDRFINNYNGWQSYTRGALQKKFKKARDDDFNSILHNNDGNFAIPKIDTRLKDLTTKFGKPFEKPPVPKTNWSNR